MSAQFGAKIGSRTYFRVFGKDTRQTLLAPDGAPESSAEPWISTERAGFRVDSELTDQDSLMVEGDFYTGSIGAYFLTTNLGTTRRDGADLLTRWTHRLTNGSETTLQLYWDNTDRNYYGSSFLRNTFDLDFQHQLTVGDQHNIVWGVRADYSANQATNAPVGGMLPSRLGFKIFDGLFRMKSRLQRTGFSLLPAPSSSTTTTPGLNGNRTLVLHGPRMNGKLCGARSLGV
jgi:hypothetical protein